MLRTALARAGGASTVAHAYLPAVILVQRFHHRQLQRPPVSRRTLNRNLQTDSSPSRRMVDIIFSGDDYYDEDEINQMFILVDVSKPGQKDSLCFLCGLYPDALGIRSVAMREKLGTSGYLVVPNKYDGASFKDLDERMKDALYGYIEKRGIDHSLFPFLQAWLYVKDHGNLLRWFKSMDTFVSEDKQDSGAQQS